MKGGTLFAILAGVAAVVYLANQNGSGSSGPENDIAQFCRGKPSEATSGLNSWISNGTIARVSKGKIEVEDKKWDAIPHDAKVSIAVFGYCNAISGQTSNTATVLLSGYRDGQVRASIVNGNYSD